MEQKRPADIFTEVLDYLWNGLGLEEKGWKRLKKGDFKKRTKNGLKMCIRDSSKAVPLQAITTERATVPTILPMLTTTPSASSAQSGITPMSSKMKPTCSSPVSYTHLDVYKRQPLPST